MNKLNVTYDLETMPTQDVEQRKRIAKNLKPPSNYKKQETIDAWIKDNEMTAINKTSFDGGIGGIYCIGLALGDDQPHVIETEDYKSFESERVVLETLNNTLAGMDPYFIGHNINGFDNLFLKKRFIIHRLKPTFYIPINAKPWDNICFDTATAWTGGKYQDYVSLDDLCNYLKVPTPKGSINGSKVWEYIKAGKGAEVASYCKRDIFSTRECYYILREFM